MQIAIKVLLILGYFSLIFAVVALAFYIQFLNIFQNAVRYIEIPIWFCLFGFLPLAWYIPMTIIYFKKTKNNEEISIAFKICALLFVNTIAGILMICDNKG